MGTATFSYVTFTIVKKQCMLTTAVRPGPQACGLARPPLLLPAARAEARTGFEQVRKIRHVWGGMTLLPQGQFCTSALHWSAQALWGIETKKQNK